MIGLLFLFIFGLTSLSECQNGPRPSADTFVMTTILTEPYMIDTNKKTEDGTPIYEGYLVDLWEHLNKKLQFEKYVIQPVADGRYGSYDETTGQWNGMIGEIISGNVDAALAPLTITEKREADIDFTKPYLNVAESVLIRKDLNINSVQELLQSQVQYGCVGQGSTAALFKRATSGVLKQIYDNMMAQEPSVIVSSTEEGETRVRTENYAFIGESVSLDYIKEGHSELMTFTIDEIPLRGYGIGLEQGSRYTEDFNNALLELQEDGTLQMLYVKWWQEKLHQHVTAGGSRLMKDTQQYFTIIAVFMAMYLYRLI